MKIRLIAVFSMIFIVAAIFVGCIAKTSSPTTVTIPIDTTTTTSTTETPEFDRMSYQEI